MPEGPTHAHQTSLTYTHAPHNPSQLREVHIPSGSPSPDDTMHRRPPLEEDLQPSSSSASHGLGFSTDGIEPAADQASVHSNEDNAAPDLSGGIFETDLENAVRTRLLDHKDWDAASGCGSENCNHGTLSPRPWTQRSYGTIDSSMPSFPGAGREAQPVDETHALLGDAFADGVLGGGHGQKLSTTQYLAKRHGIAHPRTMYVLREAIPHTDIPFYSSLILAGIWHTTYPS